VTAGSGVGPPRSRCERPRRPSGAHGDSGGRRQREYTIAGLPRASGPTSASNGTALGATGSVRARPPAYSVSRYAPAAASQLLQTAWPP
jgi:hypothetical protein